MPTVVFSQFTLGAPLNGTTLNADVQLVEDSLADLGPFIISGLVQSAGTGLTANVTAGVASIGGRVTKSAGWTIVGLADATINHLYLKNDGTGTSNTTGTQPANTVKLGTATTAGGVVTSVNVLRSSGRQTKVRPENQVAGDVGSMGSIDLGDWNATAGDGWQVFGTLPSSALPAGGGVLPQTTKTATYTATSSDYFIFCDATAGAMSINLPTAVGIAGKVYIIKKIDATANAVTIDPSGAELVDGGGTLAFNTQYTSYSIVSNNVGWWVF